MRHPFANDPAGPLLSVVVPIFNEQENLPALRNRLVAALAQTDCAWEIIFVDDGSRDQSAAILETFHEADTRIKLIRLSRNFGHQPAVTAGIHLAAGDAVVLIDGDLQDPPELILEMVAHWRAGSQVVLGCRASRTEGGPRGIGFRLFYPLLRRLTDLPGGTNAGIFGLMDRAVVDQFNRLPERNRFIPGLRSWLGFRHSTVSYHRAARASGQPKQTLRALIRYAMDAMFSFSYKPLRWVTYTGFCVSAVTFLLAVYYLITFFTRHKSPGTGFTTTILCVLFLGGIQLIGIGILGEYVGRIYEEIKQRPLYVVQELIGFEPRPVRGSDIRPIYLKVAGAIDELSDALPPPDRARRS